MSPEEMAASILTYLEERSGAGDTLEGISTWWVLGQQLTATTNLVHRALLLLKEQGRIVERKMPDSRTLYMHAGTKE